MQFLLTRRGLFLCVTSYYKLADIPLGQRGVKVAQNGISSDPFGSSANDSCFAGRGVGLEPPPPELKMNSFPLPMMGIFTLLARSSLVVASEQK